MAKAKKRASKKQPDFPGMERGNAALDVLAEKHDDLTAEKKQVKEDIIAKMKRLKKVDYQHGRVHITLTDTESVRISVAKEPSVEETEAA